MNRFLNIVLCCMIVVSASAQKKKEYTNFQDTTFRLGEVSVMGFRQKKLETTKLDVPAAYLPVSTNSLSSTVLETRGIRNIQNAVRFLPGVRVQTSYGAFQRISIRGFDNSVIMVDGVRDERSSINNSFPFMDLSSVERIELLKGPASVLYGQSVVGGVLNIVRKAPTSKQHVNARMAYGSYNNLETTLGFGGKLLGPLNYIANFNYQTQDGWRDNGMKRLSGYIALGGKISEADELDIRIGAHRDYYPTEIGLPDVMPEDIYNTSDGSKYLNKGELLPGLDRKARYNSESDFMYNRNFNASVMWKHTFSEAAKLMNKFSYTDDDIDYFGTEDLAYLTSDKPIYKHYYMSGKNKKYISLDSFRYDFPLRFSHLAKTYNNQLELGGKFTTGNIKHNYLGGYSFISLVRDSYSGYDIGKNVYGPGVTGHGSVRNPHSIGWMETNFGKVSVQRTLMHGFYLQDLIEVNEKLKVLLAGRYDLYSYKRAGGVPTIDGHRTYDMPADTLFSRVTTGAFTYRVGAVYLPVEELSIYGSIGSYFKPISYFYSEDTRYFDRHGKEFFPTKDSKVFDPEQGYQVEVGARYAWADKLEANFSVFYINKWNIRQRLANKGSVVNGETLTKNIEGQVGRMDSKGFDVDLTYKPIAGLSFTTGYGYTDARVREINSNPFLNSDELKGKQYIRVPKHTFYLYGDYEVAEGTLKGLGANFDISYQDKVFRNSTNTMAFEAYWLANAGVSYKMQNNIRLALNVYNLLDDEYFNQSLGNQLVPSMPRNFMLSASYAF